MREILLLFLFLLSSIHSALWEDGSRSLSSETEETTNSEIVPRTDFVRITRASGERHERQISRRLEGTGEGGERHMITVDRNGNILQFRRPPFFTLQQPLSSFRQSLPFFQRGITRSRSSHGFSRRRPFPPLSTPSTPLPITIRPNTTPITHDGSMTTDIIPFENTIQPPTVTREGTVTNDFRRIPSRTQSSLNGRIDSMRLVHGGSMERGIDESSIERLTVSRRIVSRPPRPLRISSSFEVLPRRENDRFRIGGPPFGEITTPVPSPRVFIQTPRPFRPRPPPPRQRPQQPRRVEALSNDEQEFIPSGRSPVSPSVVAPFRSFRPRLPSTRFTLPPRTTQFRSGFTPIHTSPLPSSSSTTFSSTEPSTTSTQSTTPSTTTFTESSTTTQSTTPSTTTIEDSTTTLSTTIGTTATTSRPTVSFLSTSRRPTVSIATTSRLPTRPSTTPRPKLTPPRTDKTTTVFKTTPSIGKTTTVSKMTTVTPSSTRVTPPPTTSKTRKTGTTRGFATVSPSISVKALPPAIPDDLTFNEIRGPLPPSPLPSLQPHSTTARPPSHGAPSFPPSSSFDGPPGEMPPSDNIVQMLNSADDFLDMAKRLNITRKARIARRRRRMAEYGRLRW